ncbi:Ubiquitin-like protein ATG12 [Diplonema papillatum]|nr:Ubiquitin-like protein ATG12 [Diplonema papillatum]KAJ9451586.1 Ubiquitin-like protein ATG12 [Diplonema papillatum]|eukprot:gene720-1098_t
MSSPATPSPANQTVTVFLSPGPETPKLKQAVYKLPGNKTISFVHTCLRRYLAKYRPKNEPIFVFINTGDSIGFSPTPEQTVGDLFDKFSDGKRLTLTYVFKQIYG